MDFASYRSRLVLETAGGALWPPQLRTVASIASALFHCLGIVGLLACNAGRLLARYERR